MQDHYPAVLSLTRINVISISRGSATLLEGGKYVLTAAHLIEGVTDLTDIRLRGPELTSLPDVQQIYVHPGWDRSTFSHDIAIIELKNPLTHIDGLLLHTDEILPGTEFTRVGYGYGKDSAQHIGTNTWDSNGNLLQDNYSRTVPDGSQLLYDYDNGNEAQNSLNQLTGSQSSAAPLEEETLATGGDSGGPALVDGAVAGIASYVIADSRFDIDTDSNSSAGEIGADTHLHAYSDWLDYVFNGNSQPTPPETAAQVEKAAREVDFGETVTYFLLQSSRPYSDPVTLWYQTIDGSAAAGEDYLASSGWVTLNPGKTETIIAVTLLGDQAAENDETFSLEISDPAGYWLDPAIKLIATRTIIDNDSGLI